METTEEPVCFIRESTRNLLKLNRVVQKDKISDGLRDIETTRITHSSLADIANRLKSKSLISLSELHILKNSIIDDAKNIELVLSTHGALRGLVRELSGNNVKRQTAAAGCCCNLALGDSKACFTVAKAAGPYLVVALDNFNEELAVTCAWALGNLSGAGPRACAALRSLGAPAALAARASGPSEHVAAAAAYALAHYACQMKDELSPDHVNKILEAYSNTELTPASAQLLFILSCYDHLSERLPDALLQRLLQALAVSTQKHQTSPTDTNDSYELAHLIRTLANVSVNKENSDVILHYFIENRLCVVFKRVLLSDASLVRESLLWLLGNLYKWCDRSEFFNDLVYC